MKIVQPSSVPVPDRKPEVPAGTTGTGMDFRTVLAGAAVPVPGRKPEVPAAPAAASTDTAAASSTSGRLAEATRRVAGLSGHSFTAILAQASQESGFDASARNKASSATGPFQFLDRTWLDLFRRHGAAYGEGDLARTIESRNGLPVVKDPAARREILALRQDPDIAAGLAARYLSEGRARLETRLGRPVSETESRIAYVFGVGGATKLIRAAETAPDTAAAKLLPGAAKANRNLFYDRAGGRALGAGETVARLAQRMEGEQRAMFDAIARAGEAPVPLDGGDGSPFDSFQLTDTPDAEDTGTPV